MHAEQCFLVLADITPRNEMGSESPFPIHPLGNMHAGAWARLLGHDGASPKAQRQLPTRIAHLISEHTWTVSYPDLVSIHFELGRFVLVNFISPRLIYNLAIVHQLFRKGYLGST